MKFENESIHTHEHEYDYEWIDSQSWALIWPWMNWFIFMLLLMKMNQFILEFMSASRNIDRNWFIRMSIIISMNANLRKSVRDSYGIRSEDALQNYKKDCKTMVNVWCTTNTQNFHSRNLGFRIRSEKLFEGASRNTSRPHLCIPCASTRVAHSNITNSEFFPLAGVAIRRPLHWIFSWLLPWSQNFAKFVLWLVLVIIFIKTPPVIFWKFL